MDIKGPYYGSNMFEARQKIGSCIICHKFGPYTVHEQRTVYRNF